MSRTLSTYANRVAKEFFVLDSAGGFGRRLGERHCLPVSKKGELPDVLAQSSDATVWIVANSRWAESLLQAVSAYVLFRQRRVTFGDLLMLQPVARLGLLPPLHSRFRRIVGAMPEYRMLPHDQLAEVLCSENKSDLFIGGIVDRLGGTITLARGDLMAVTVPLSIFQTQGPCRPDFSRFGVDDYGATLRFGAYEASSHGVLYRLDPAYRRRAQQQRIAEERGFGPSLRRLRILRRLSRGDFPGISSKTIARIERGETGKPQGKTMENLAKALGVMPAEIETY
jgi:hypothetical protein